MIRIVEKEFQLTKMGGRLVLDHVFIGVVGIDLRNNRGGSPSIHCDVIYGQVDAEGEFHHHDYDSLETTKPVYIEPGEFALRTAHRRKMAMGNGLDVCEAMILWLEECLVKKGLFGPHAVVLTHRHGVVKKTEKKHEEIANVDVDAAGAPAGGADTGAHNS